MPGCVTGGICPGVYSWVYHHPFHCWWCFRTSLFLDFLPVMRDLGGPVRGRTVSLSPPASLLDGEKVPLFPDPVIPGLGLIIGENGFIPAQFLHFLDQH